MMRLQPIVYVADMEASTSWYATLLGVEPDLSGGHWTTFPVGGGHLALHLADPSSGPGAAGGVELSLVVDEPLEQVAARLHPNREIADEAFGRSLIVRDPDGALIQVNEHDPELTGG